MSQGKFHPKAKVPFAWENKPGISKISHHHHHQDRRCGDAGTSIVMKLLPPPPCPPEKARVSVHHGAPSWTFLRSSSSKGWIGKSRDDQILDPFLIALEECTRTPAPSSSQSGNNSKNGWFGRRLRRNMFDFSCKSSSCSVRDDSMVKMPQSCRLTDEDGRGGCSSTKKDYYLASSTYPKIV